MNMLLERTTSPKLQGRRRSEMKHRRSHRLSRIPHLRAGSSLPRTRKLAQASCRPAHGLGGTPARDAPETRCARGSRNRLARTRRGEALLCPRVRPRRKAAPSRSIAWPEGEARFRRPIGHRLEASETKLSARGSAAAPAAGRVRSIPRPGCAHRRLRKRSSQSLTTSRTGEPRPGCRRPID